MIFLNAVIFNGNKTSCRTPIKIYIRPNKKIFRTFNAPEDLFFKSIIEPLFKDYFDCIVTNAVAVVIDEVPVDLLSGAMISIAAVPFFLAAAAYAA